MEKIGNLINLDRKKLNPNWELAAEVGNITKTTPNRWLREVRDNKFALERALIDFRELTKTQIIKSKPAFFTYLFNKHKHG